MRTFAKYRGGRAPSHLSKNCPQLGYVGAGFLQLFRQHILCTRMGGAKRIEASYGTGHFDDVFSCCQALVQGWI